MLKHPLKITLILIAMFLLTQFIGLYVSNYYLTEKVPFGINPESPETSRQFNSLFISIVIAFIIAIALIFFLMNFKIAFFIKIWFLFVVSIGLGISFNSFLPFTPIIALIIAVPLAFLKVFYRNFFIHNITELFIYPGIASVFIPLLNFYTLIFLLILISVYDMWAVWKSGIMQKMAKYQIKKVGIFAGFFVPHLSKKQKLSLKKSKSKKVKVNVAILGGGDIVFPIIAAGVILKVFGFANIFGYNIPLASILVILGALLGISYLFFTSEKKKFYPAMPFITAGIFLGIIISYVIYKILGISIILGSIF